MGHGSKIQVSRQIQYDGSTALAQSAVRRMMVNHTSGTIIESNLEVPAELREAEKTIDQAERAFDLFFDAARRSSSTAPMPVQEFSKLVLAFWEESLKTSFEYARKLALTSSLQEAANVLAELVKQQIGSAQRHIQELARATAAKDQT